MHGSQNYFFSFSKILPRLNVGVALLGVPSIGVVKIPESRLERWSVGGSKDSEKL